MLNWNLLAVQSESTVLLTNLFFISLMIVRLTGCKLIRYCVNSSIRAAKQSQRLPGVPPTNLRAEVPFTAIVNIRGDRLFHEHIGWDQGTVLRQLGLLPEYLPFPYLVPGHASSNEGKSIEYKVPVGGSEVARKMRDRDSVPSNEMFECRVRIRQM